MEPNLISDFNFMEVQLNVLRSTSSGVPLPLAWCLVCVCVCVLVRVLVCVCVCVGVCVCVECASRDRHLTGTALCWGWRDCQIQMTKYYFLFQIHILDA